MAPSALRVERNTPMIVNYGGTYELAPGRNIVVTPGRDRLMMNFPGNPDTLTMFAEAQDRFFFTTRDEVIEFQSNGDQPVTRLVIHSGGSDQVAVRKTP